MYRSPAYLTVFLLVCAIVAAGQSSGSVEPKSPRIDPRAPASGAPQTPAPPEAQPTAPKSQVAGDEPQEPQPPTQPPPQPKTEILDTSDTSAALATDGHDPILDPPPFPKGMTTLVGGVISDIDRIRNHLTLDIFGGGRWTVFFDERTHAFRNGAEVTVLALKKGEQAYVDTMLDNNKRDIFARNIRVGVVSLPADADGQITDIDTSHNQLTLRDILSSTSVRFAVDSSTRISHGSTPASFQELRAGSLVRVQFAPERPNRGLAREIVILAAPGSAFTFTGTVTFLDTHRNMLSVHNAADDKTYDIYFVPSRADAARRLAVGAEVRVVAIFEATQYTAQQITVTRMAGEASNP
jgi:Domain of unknown function (DUF5666)